ncbi:hypothetical protein SAMN05444413_11329 [Roseivivax marinus]|uniref:YeeE/YedE family protein n=1 Tax=Roseivivax marinus TaxID=1379903 RepID=UPI0008CBDBB7|nr:YeeE/YedE family protein [Roseivivax marinus]SEL67084.1 hypothetical protein SAMN05444413_11329 [Roseivivax marinus]
MELSTPTEFTPWLSLGGGILIGLSAVIVMALFGRIAGISGITTGVMGAVVPMQSSASDRDWRIAFVVGLVTAPILYAIVTGGWPEQTVPSAPLGMIAAGLIVGVGTALGSGCTSGHGVCGLARLSPRSLAAVVTFMATAAITVFVLRHVI